MTTREYLRMLRKRWLYVVLPTLLGFALMAALSLISRPIYTAAANVYFSMQSATSANDLASGANYTIQQLDSYAALATLPVVLDPVITELQLDTTAQGLAGSITATAATSTVIVNIAVTNTSPTEAATIANAVANQLGIQVRKLSPTSAKGQATVTATVVGPASAPTVPTSPKTVRNVGAGVLSGLLLGLLLATVRSRLDNRVRNLDGMPDLATVGVIAADKRVRKAPLIVQGHDHSRRAEAFRQLRTNLQFVDVDEPPRVIVVTSAVAGEGKSTTAANLAVVFAETDLDVLLIEADLRKPKLSDYLGIERSVGLTNVLAGLVDVDDVLQPWGTGALTVLPSGFIPPNPAELLGSRNMHRLLDELRQRFEVIIIDTPPLLPVTDGAVAAVQADGALIVTRYGKTSRVQLESAVQALRAVDASLLGCVLNMVPQSEMQASADYNGYGYYEEANAGAASPPQVRSNVAAGQNIDHIDEEGANMPVEPGEDQPAMHGSPIEVTKGDVLDSPLGPAWERLSSHNALGRNVEVRTTEEVSEEL